MAPGAQARILVAAAIAAVLAPGPAATGQVARAAADDAPLPPPPGMRAFPVAAAAFRVLERDSGPRDYYRLAGDPAHAYIRAVYGPWLETVTLFAPVPDELRRGVRLIRFRWRALVLPQGGNECAAGKGDGAANVYITWKRGMRWYSVKLVWSTDAPVAETCNSQRNPFVAADSLIVRSGGPTGVWRAQEIDPDALYREHFEGGRPDAEVPELQGIGLLTDGDQTHSVSAADYADFVLYKDSRVVAARH